MYVMFGILIVFRCVFFNSGCSLVFDGLKTWNWRISVWRYIL